MVWVGSPPIFPFKPRDFCTVVHIRKLKDGTMVVLNRAIKHPKAPETSKYQRAAIVQAANIIQPVPGSSVCYPIMYIRLYDDLLTSHHAKYYLPCLNLSSHILFDPKIHLS